MAAIGALSLLPEPQNLTEELSPEAEQTISLELFNKGALSFSGEYLDKLLGCPIGSVKGITITGLPKSSEGQLSLYGKSVAPYQKISRGELSSLVLRSLTDVSALSFSFVPQTEESIKTVVNATVTSRMNTAPISESRSFHTFSGVSVYGTFPCYDAEGDTLLIKLLTKPKNGQLTLSGQSFCYSPYDGKAGSDSFTFAVLDSAGAASKEGKISIEVFKNKENWVFSDMTNNGSHYSALTLSRKGMMTGEVIGGKHLFSPKREVTAADFVTLLILARGDTQNTAVINTGLAEDSLIPLWQKPYIQKALQLKIIDKNTFKPSSILTRQEAVALTAKAADFKAASASNLLISDRDKISPEFLEGYLKLSQTGMLNLYENGAARPADPLTRDFASDLLCIILNRHS